MTYSGSSRGVLYGIDAREKRCVFCQGLRTQGHVFVALLTQEMSQQMGRSGLGFIASVVEPLLHIGVIVSWHYIMRVQPIYGPSTLLFVSTGIVPVFLFIQLSAKFRSASASSKDGGRFPLVSRLDAMLASSVLQLMAHVLMSFLLFGLVFWSGVEAAWPRSIGPVLEAMALLIALGFGVGLCNATLGRIWSAWHFIYAPAARLLIVFSGVLYVPDFLIPRVRYLMSWNPVMHAVSIFRQGFYSHYPDLVLSRPYVYGCALFMITMGLSVERVARHMKEH